MSEEIRPIRATEADQFLNLLCEVFDLDRARAQRIFFTEPLFDLGRKWAVVQGGEPVCILTTVPLEFGWGKAIGIAGVGTKESHRSEGLGHRLLNAVLSAAETDGVAAAMLFARNTGLYMQVGFEVKDEVVRSHLQVGHGQVSTENLDYDVVHDLYTRWSEANPDRLRRDDRRWDYWRWNMRTCTPFADGYVCNEAGVVRECVFGSPPADWILPRGTEWFGLSTLADKHGVPLGERTSELFLMCRNVPGQPEMFMTDQF